MTMLNRSYGTAGILDISQQNQSFNIIRLGFNFEFNLVCFLAERSRTYAKSPPLNEDGLLYREREVLECDYLSIERAELGGI